MKNITPVRVRTWTSLYHPTINLICDITLALVYDCVSSQTIIGAQFIEVENIFKIYIKILLGIKIYLALLYLL